MERQILVGLNEIAGMVSCNWYETKGVLSYVWAKVLATISFCLYEVDDAIP